MPATADSAAAQGKKVSFAPDSKPAAPEPSARASTTAAGQPKADETQLKVDGVIGQLEVHRSGAVKMRLGNGIVLDVCVIGHS